MMALIARDREAYLCRLHRLVLSLYLHSKPTSGTHLLPNILLPLPYTTRSIRMRKKLVRRENVAAWRPDVTAVELGRIEQLAETVKARWWWRAAYIRVAFELRLAQVGHFEWRA